MWGGTSVGGAFYSYFRVSVVGRFRPGRGAGTDTQCRHRHREIPVQSTRQSVVVLYGETGRRIG